MSRDGNPFLTRTGKTKLKDRAFIDLSFNGVAVSELGLTVTYDSNMQDIFGPDFQNVTSQVSRRDGTIYWGTNVTSSTITKTLSTQKMTSLQYRKLKALFAPGVIGKLILGQRPYCYMYAVVNQVPTTQLVPFDDIVYIGSKAYNDTVYKGSIEVSFLCLQKHWLGDQTLDKFQDYVYTDSNQPWLLQSGLLPQSQINNIDFVQSATEADTLLTNKTFSAYNAGNGNASGKLKFDIACQSTDNLSILSQSHIVQCNDKNDNKLYSLTIAPCRALQDISYTIQILDGKDLTKSEVKSKIIQLLKQDLNSNSKWRSMILSIVQGNTSSSDISDKLKTMVSCSNFHYQINAISHQMILKITHPKIISNSVSTTQTDTVVENIEGTTNGEYIIVYPGNGIEQVNKMKFTIKSSQEDSGSVYKNINLFFLNEYV